MVDEGQDFRDEFWFPLLCLLTDENESTLYVFLDHNQAIYKPITKLPIDDDPFVLTTNCRNTIHIHDAAYHYYKGIPTDEPEIAGEPIESLCAPSIRAQAARLQSRITELILKEKVRQTDIAVLVAAGAKTAYYAEIKDKPLPQGAKWSIEAHRVPDSVLVDTVSRFKGLESAIIFLWGPAGAATGHRQGEPICRLLAREIQVVSSGHRADLPQPPRFLGIVLQWIHGIGRLN